MIKNVINLNTIICVTISKSNGGTITLEIGPDIVSRRIDFKDDDRFQIDLLEIISNDFFNEYDLRADTTIGIKPKLDLIAKDSFSFDDFERLDLIIDDYKVIEMKMHLNKIVSTTHYFIELEETINLKDRNSNLFFYDYGQIHFYTDYQVSKVDEFIHPLSIQVKHVSDYSNKVKKLISKIEP